MEVFIRYILLSTFCLSILYAGYLIFQKRETRIHQLRYYLLISIVLSLIIPLSTLQIDLNLFQDKFESEEIIQETENIATITDVTKINQLDIKPKIEKNWNISSFLIIIYLIGFILFGLRLLFQFIKIICLFGISEKIKKERIVLLSNKNGNSFTFFNWIFIPSYYYGEEETKDIISHEKIHASQYHSIDLMLIELLSAVMWFNPLVWMMKDSVQLVHEYLADEGVLNTGTDKLKYQALLINQVAEEKFICLSSGFNNSLIKKRMIMMTKNKFNRGSKLKFFALIPLATILFIVVACIKGQEVNKNSKAFTVVIDAGHGGKDSGVKFNDKITEKDLSLSIAKMLKEKASRDMKLNLILTREKDEFLELNKRINSDADLFISIHINFSKNTDISGIECFIAKNSENKTESKNIGKLVVSELNQLSGMKTSLKETDFLVLRESKCPALLLNIGYISNPYDLSFITDKYNQGLICDKILNVINQLN
ncbi:MAG: N-acetylmuramoyl-L-alanine amidase [Bacteroidetes bacterium]|nr:N-acetylmuramoyl-L-alanine amidase [Bacteroidota bacterium]